MSNLRRKIRPLIVFNVYITQNNNGNCATEIRNTVPTTTGVAVISMEENIPENLDEIPIFKSLDDKHSRKCTVTELEHFEKCISKCNVICQ